MQANPDLTRAVDAAQHLTDASPPWDELLSSTRQFLGGDSATFIVFEPKGGLVVARQYGVDASAEREYVERYHALDIMTARTQHAAQGTWFDSAAFSKDGLQVGERDYLDYMHRHRMRQMVGFVAIRSAALQGGFTIQRSTFRTCAPHWWERAEMRHFSAAMQQGLMRLHQKRQDWITHSQNAMEAFGEALCILTPQGRVLHASPAAEALLGDGRGLCVRQGLLWHSDAAMTKHLAVSLHTAGLQMQSCSVQLRDAAGQLWGHADLAPAPAWTGMGGQAPVLMRLRPAPVSDKALFQRRLAEAFGLTPSEARVLEGLASGQSIAEQAQAHGTSIHTVRSQVSVLRRKLDCSRQVDLVRKALSLRG